ncbi:MAG: hypothetical protein ACO3GO_01015 [Terrimicrobiaceae bacterium]
MKKTLALLLILTVVRLDAATSNGNDFALDYSEAKTDRDRKILAEDAQGRPHFFRYLKITDLVEVEEGGKKIVKIAATEPSSLYSVRFSISSPVSLKLLLEDPATGIGDALAVTGNLNSVDSSAQTIELDKTIIRHKDRSERKPGKELLAEVSPDAVVYSFTEGPRPISVKARDRDLLEKRDGIMAQGGKEAWFKFLEEELAKRAAGGKQP